MPPLTVAPRPLRTRNAIINFRSFRRNHQRRRNNGDQWRYCFRLGHDVFGECFTRRASPLHDDEVNFEQTYFTQTCVSLEQFINSLFEIVDRSSRTEPPDLAGIMRVTDDMIDSLVCPPPPTDPPVMSEEMISGLIVPAPGWSKCSTGS